MSDTLRIYSEANEKGEARSWLEAYVEHQRYSESPTSFHFWTGVSTIAGALRRRVWIDQRHFQWTPNMYIVLVAPAGVAAKSTSIRGGLSLLERVEDVVFGPQSMTWQALIQSFKRSRKTFTVSDSTEDRIMSSITVGVGELGTFLNPDDRELVDFLTAIWDGQVEVFRRETKVDGKVEIPNPWLNLIACTTPAWLRDRFPEVLVGGGLTSRIVFVYGESKRQLVPYPSQLIEDAAYKEEEHALVFDLQQIGGLAGEYKLSESALAFGDKWYRGHNNGGLPAHLASGRFDGYIARKQTHIHKLAMVLAASKRNELIITREDLEEAEGHISGLEPSMLTVFNSIGVDAGAQKTSDILTLIRNHGKIDYQRLHQLCIRTYDPRSFGEAVKAAVESGIVKKEKIGENNWNLTYIGARR